MKTYLLILFLVFPLFSYTQHWDSLGLGTDREIKSLYSDDDNDELYVTGNFMIAGGDTVSCIAMWDGTQWNKLDKGAFRAVPQSHCSPVFGVTKYQGSIYATGQFFEAKMAFARWNGITWDSITSFDGAITQFMEYQNELYVNGVFSGIDTIDAWGIAKWDGQKWSAIDTTHWNGHGIYTSTVYNGELYIGGNFWNDDESIVDLAKFNGTTWEAVDNYPYQGASSAVNELLEYKGRLYVIGTFEQPDFPGNSIIAWDGSTWDDLNGGLSPYSGASVFDAHIHNDKLYVGGGFLGAGDIPATALAIWDDTTWCALGTSFTNGITAFETYKDDLIIAIGYGLIDSVNYNHIARWVGGDYLDTCSTILSSIEDIETTSYVNIYPNPVTDILHIDTDIDEVFNVEILSITGQRIFIQNDYNQYDELNISSLPAGIYFIRIFNEKHRTIKKIVKH